MASKSASNSGTLPVRSAFAAWFVTFSVAPPLIAICAHRHAHTHPNMLGPTGTYVLSRRKRRIIVVRYHQPSLIPRRPWMAQRCVSTRTPILIYPKPIPPADQYSLLAPCRTQEELSHRLDHIYRRLQGGPFPPSTSIIRSCASLPPPMVPTSSPPSTSTTATTAVGILLHPPTLYVLYVN